MLKFFIFFLLSENVRLESDIQPNEPPKNVPIFNFSFLKDGFKIPSFLLGNFLKNWKAEDGNPEELGDYFEGDILFPISDSSGRSALANESYMWTNAIIPYVVTGKFSKFSARFQDSLFLLRFLDF